MTQRPTETFREFVERREPELANEVDRLRAQLIPLEKELADVRRTMETLGLRTSNRLASLLVGGMPTVTTYHPPSGIAELVGALPPLASLLSPGSNLAEGLSGALGISSTEHLTIKQLALKALAEHFPNGATTAELCEFFRNAYGREIERSSLSPQLSRLKEDGLVEQPPGMLNEGKWKVTRSIDFLREYLRGR